MEWGVWKVSAVWQLYIIIIIIHCFECNSEYHLTKPFIQLKPILIKSVGYPPFTFLVFP